MASACPGKLPKSLGNEKDKKIRLRRRRFGVYWPNPGAKMESQVESWRYQKLQINSANTGWPGSVPEKEKKCEIK
jgi:hypothetical protein